MSGKEEVVRWILEKGGGLEIGVGRKDGEQEQECEGEDVGVEEIEGGAEGKVKDGEEEVDVEEGMRGPGVGGGP